MQRVVRNSFLCSIVTLLLSAPPVAAEPACGSFRAAVPDPALDLAPPAGFTEICAQDAALCVRLTSGFSKDTNTIGYFVPAEEWKRYQAGDHSKFRRTLIAQWAESTQPSRFPVLKKFIRSQHGKEKSESQEALVWHPSGKADIPVFEDSKDVIAAGVLVKQKQAGPDAPETVLASVNIAMVKNTRTLSLYVITDVTASPSAEPAKALGREWIRCLRAAK